LGGQCLKRYWQKIADVSDAGWISVQRGVLLETLDQKKTVKWRTVIVTNLGFETSEPLALD
jgi:hypothetical protein